MKTLTVLCLAVLFGSTSLRAQQRYIDEIFSDVEVVHDQEYGVNISVLIGGPESLLCDIYMPVGDTLTKRPLVVVLHNGTFLPRGAVAPTGDKDDYGNVEICRRLAKRGYVAASIQYRKGWIPFAQEDIVRRLTIINATYRGIQDVYGFLRFMNNSVEQGNLFGIDGDRVALFGLGTGAVVALNAAALNSVEETYIPKFSHPIDGTRFIDTNMVGDIHGIKQAAINIPNYVDYKDDFHFVFGIDGLVGDSSWLEIGTCVPLAVAGVVNHPTTPYGLDPVDMDLINCDLPVFAGSGTDTYVVNISGSACVASKANALGINDNLNRCPYVDPVSETIRNNPHVKGQEHLWGIDLPGAQTGPWEFWDANIWVAVPSPYPGVSIHDLASATNPDMSLEKANAYIDTLLWFFAPRALTALNLDTTCFVAAMRSEQIEKLEIMPNPVEDILYIRNPGNVWVFRLVNTLGQTLSETQATAEDFLSIKMEDFQPGLFILSAYDENGHLIANARILKI